MSRWNRGTEQGPPGEEPQGNPRDLHPTSDIRFVMLEVAKLSQRMETFSVDLAKIGPSVDKAVDKLASDFKERVAEIKLENKDTRDSIKTEGKETRDSIKEIEKNFSFFKGAAWVFGGLFALFLVITGVILREWLTK